MPPYSILIVKGNYGIAGGPETIISSILAQLDRAKFRPQLVLLRKPDGPVPHALEGGRAGGPPIEIAWRGIARTPSVVRTLRQVAQQQAAVLIDAHDMRANLTAYALTRVCRIPWIARAHGWLGHTHSGRWKTYERIEAILIRRADLTLVGSHATMREVQSLGVHRVEVVPNGIEIPAPVALGSEAREVRDTIGAPRDCTVIGVVGRLHPGKGQAVVLHAIARLRKQGRNLLGLFVGDGPDRESLQHLATRLGIGDSVRFTGFAPSLMPHVAAMDIVVVPSLKESLPLTALEAMALERPVVATRVGDLPQVIEDGVSGLLVPPGDDGALCDALESLVLNAKTRQRLAACGREVVVARYSAQAMARTLEAIYSRVISEASHHA